MITVNNLNAFNYSGSSLPSEADIETSGADSASIRNSEAQYQRRIDEINRRFEENMARINANHRRNVRRILTFTGIGLLVSTIWVAAAILSSKD